MENDKHICNIEDLCGSIAIITGLERIDGKMVRVSPSGYKVWCKDKGGWSNLIIDEPSEITWDRSKDIYG